MRMKLTDRYLRSHRPEENEEIYDEGGCTGFGVRVGKRGASFFVAYMRGGKKQRAKIGAYDPEGKHGWKLADARAEAERIRGNKLDPAAERRRAKQAGTFATVARRFLEEMPRAKRRADAPSLRASTAVTYKRQLENLLIPEFGELRLDEITRDDVEEFFAKIALTRPVHANRTFALMRRLMNWSFRKGWIPVNPCAGLEAPGGEERPSGKDWTADELRRVLQAAELEEPVPRALVKLAFRTGCRGGELRKAEWTWIDVEAEVLRLPSEATKAAEAREVVLVPQTLAVLEDLRGLTGSGRYLFPNSKGSYLATVEKTVKRLRKRSADEENDKPPVEFTLHDVRDALANYAGDEESGGTVDTVKRLLGHKLASGATKHYLRARNLPEQRRVLQRWNDYLDELLTGKKARVVRFRR